MTNSIFRLRDVAHIKRNIMSSRRLALEETGELMEIKIGMIKSQTKIDYSDANYVAKNDRTIMVEKNDIIIKRISPVFATLFLGHKEKIALGGNLLIVRLKKEFSNEIYVPYLACCIDSQIDTMTRGETIPSVALSELENLQIPVLNMKKQVVLGDAWVENSIQRDIDTELIDKSFEYNQNLIRLGLEVL